VAYGSVVLRPLLDRHGFGQGSDPSRAQRIFGGNIAVAGLITGADLSRTLAGEAPGRYLLPDVCLSKGRSSTGSSTEDLPLPVEVVATDGSSLRRLLEELR